MKINQTNFIKPVNKYQDQGQESKSKSSIKKQSNQADSVSFSSDSKKLNELGNKLSNESMNLDKVDRIKGAIKEGTYQVDSKALAKKMMEF